MSASAGPFAEDLASDTSGSSEEDASGSDEDVAAWISWFVSLRGNEFFCEVDEDFIQDDFNLSGLSSQVQGPRLHAPACRCRPALACAWCMTCGATSWCTGCLSAHGQQQGVWCGCCSLQAPALAAGGRAQQALPTLWLAPLRVAGTHSASLPPCTRPLLLQLMQASHSLSVASLC